MDARPRYRGYWRRDTFGRPPPPYITAEVYVTRFQTEHTVKFLIDTGADRTTLHPADSRLLVPDFRVLGRALDLQGVGGIARTFVETGAIALLSEDLVPHIIPLELHIAAPTQLNARLPSLLGRDVLNSFRLTLDETADMVVLE